MKKKVGFTLIEVIVAVAIIAILTGVMVPVMYKVWDYQNIELTKERMGLLKMAMVGDTRLVQNGVRYSYGYVGDFGQLPMSLDDNDLKKYVSFDFDNDNYRKDSWNNYIQYGYSLDASGRRVTGKLTSFGPDGKPNSGDEIELNIVETEVAPTNNILGKIETYFTNPPQTSNILYMKVIGQYKDDESNCCIPVNISGGTGNTQVYYTYDFQCTFGENLPIGLAKFFVEAYTDNSCSNKMTGQVSQESLISVSDRISSIYVNVKINLP